MRSRTPLHSSTLAASVRVAAGLALLAACAGERADVAPADSTRPAGTATDTAPAIVPPAVVPLPRDTSGATDTTGSRPLVRPTRPLPPNARLERTPPAPVVFTPAPGVPDLSAPAATRPVRVPRPVPLDSSVRPPSA